MEPRRRWWWWRRCHALISKTGIQIKRQRKKESTSLATRKMAKYFFTMTLLLSAFVCGTRAQDASSALTGLITDPSGAAIGSARVVAVPASGQPVSVRTGANGMYEFKTL